MCLCFRRMFPHCSVSLSGLQPFANYVIMMDMVPVDSFKYKVWSYATQTSAGLWFSQCSTFYLVDDKKNWIRLQYVKHSSLQPDISLPTLGHSPLHIKAFQCFLFVYSRLEAQSISIPFTISEWGAVSHPYIQQLLHQLLWPIWSQI